MSEPTTPELMERVREDVAAAREYDPRLAAVAVAHFHRRLRVLGEGTVREPLEHLNAIATARVLVDQAQDVLVAAVAVERARGRSWSSIGEELGVTRQSAHERFAHRIR